MIKDDQLSDLLKRRLALLAEDANRPLLAQGFRGIERETLRVNADGKLAMTPHPASLGSTLTNAQITTDYSESLLEFITPPEHDISTVLDDLDKIHRFAHVNLGSEMLWSQSMPCHLPDDDQIPIAWYGTSHIGMLKHVYRRGLALRYGRTMQCIAGIHYNYSLSEDLWRLLKKHESDSTETDTHFQSESYVAMIRNFHRYSWLLMYLFGASPALSTHFLRGRQHDLEAMSDDTLYLPYATSLRMSDLGYQNDAQAGIMPPYNTLRQYMKSLTNAVQRPYPPYEELGAKRNGEWWQINTNVLQIENEFYASIRPKRVIKSGERAVEALCARGVQYVEVRCMDVNPFEPLGISLQTSRFLDAFLLFCALTDSPQTNEAEWQQNVDNFSHTVKEGRKPGLMLRHNGADIELKAWGMTLLDQIDAAAELLDQARGDDVHAESMQVQRQKLESPQRTPSAQVLAELRFNGGSFERFALEHSKRHADEFKARPLSAEDTAFFQKLAQSSLDEQAKMEREQCGDFDAFITDYRSRTPKQLCDE
jgi:glutamate--cysteine ligase